MSWMDGGARSRPDRKISFVANWRERERESHVTQRSISGALWRPRQIVLKTHLRYCDSVVGHAVSAQRDYLARDLHTEGELLVFSNRPGMLISVFYI